jgi:hypothetical protein
VTNADKALREHHELLLKLQAAMEAADEKARAAELNTNQEQLELDKAAKRKIEAKQSAEETAANKAAEEMKYTKRVEVAKGEHDKAKEVVDEATHAVTAAKIAYEQAAAAAVTAGSSEKSFEAQLQALKRTYEEAQAALNAATSAAAASAAALENAQIRLNTDEMKKAKMEKVFEGASGYAQLAKETLEEKRRDASRLNQEAADAQGFTKRRVADEIAAGNSVTAAAASEKQAANNLSMAKTEAEAAHAAYEAQLAKFQTAREQLGIAHSQLEETQAELSRTQELKMKSIAEFDKASAVSDAATAQVSPALKDWQDTNTMLQNIDAALTKATTRLETAKSSREKAEDDNVAENAKREAAATDAQKAEDKIREQLAGIQMEYDDALHAHEEAEALAGKYKSQFEGLQQSADSTEVKVDQLESVGSDLHTQFNEQKEHLEHLVSEMNTDPSTAPQSMLNSEQEDLIMLDASRHMQ